MTCDIYTYNNKGAFMINLILHSLHLYFKLNTANSIETNALNKRGDMLVSRSIQANTLNG